MALQEKGSLVAIKSVNVTKLSQKLRQNLDEEVKILRKLHHPHIVALFDCLESKTQVHLMMEFCELGDLSTFIKKRSTLGEHETTQDMIKKYPNPPVGGLNEVVCRHFLKQIASAISYLHERSFLHRDIKPQNLLLSPPPLWYEKHRSDRMPLMVDKDTEKILVGLSSLPLLKVADFGFARFLPSLSLAETLCGSPLYMAPEILGYKKYDNKADLWSVGAVLHEMVVGKPPFRANNHVELLKKIENAHDKIRFPESLVLSSEMKVAIRSLLRKDPLDRIGYEKFFALEAVVDDIPGLADEDKVLTVSRTENHGMKPSEIDPTKFSTQDTESNQSPLTSPGPQGTEDIATTSRPNSRRLSTHAALPRTPPKNSAQAQTPISPAIEDPTPKPKERRPTLNTAVATFQQDRLTANETVGVEKQRDGQHQPTSMLREHLRTENPKQDEKALKEIQERAANDVAFERDYVVVEKRSVEVNALADELGLQAGYQAHQGAMVRRATTSGAPLSSTAPHSTATRAMQIVGRPSPFHQRGPSYERRYGQSPTSGTSSAIAKALNMAHNRLFGIGYSPPSGKGPSPPHGYAAFPTYPTAESGLLPIFDGSKTLDRTDEDTRVALRMEDLATRSDVVWGFAEVKYQQLIPATPAGTHGLGIAAHGKRNDEVGAVEDDDLTVDAIVAIAEEALVLYVKALAILAKAMDLAGSWWGQKNRGEIMGEFPRSLPTRTSHSPAVFVQRINSVVQWCRNRFNDCLEKSEFVGRKLIDAQHGLPLDHPGHPSNHPSMSERSSANATAVGTTSTENITLTSGVTAEKLMYDRALEMSKAAAVNELVNTDLEGGEVSYRTAIYMLQAILEGDDVVSRGSKVSKADNELVNGLESEDRATVQKRKYLKFMSGESRSTKRILVLEHVKARLRQLKKKLEIQRAAKRHSTHTPLARTPPAGISPSATPNLAQTPPR